VVGEIAFGPEGECTPPPIIRTQFRGITDHDLAQFKHPATHIGLLPDAYKSGDFIYPHESTAP